MGVKPAAAVSTLLQSAQIRGIRSVSAVWLSAAGDMDVAFEEIPPA